MAPRLYTDERARRAPDLIRVGNFRATPIRKIPHARHDRAGGAETCWRRRAFLVRAAARHG
jgi:hypothetical protein